MVPLLLSLLLILRVGTQFFSNTPEPHGCYNYGLCSYCPSPNDTDYCTCAANKCVCQNGTTGSYCENIIDTCTPSPCPTTGEWNCTSTVEGPVCSCAEGYTGAQCDIPLGSPCALSPCLNGGTCTASSDNTTFTCSCSNDYVPPLCKYPDPCKYSPCQNGATCVPIYDGERAFCQCADGYWDRICGSFQYAWANDSSELIACYAYDKTLEDSSKYLRIADSKMTYTMCRQLLESQTVVPPYTHFTLLKWNCYLSRDNYLNASAPQYDKNCNTSCPGDKWEICGDWPNGGHNARVLLSTDDYYIPVQKCSIITDDPCNNGTGGGMCMSMNSTWTSAAGTQPGYMCLCKSPYKPNTTDYGSCIAPAPCDPNPCLNDGNCTATTDMTDYTCTCEPGYVGKDCNAQSTCDPNPCLYGGKCIDQLNGKFTCDCLEWYSGTICEEINVCEYADPCKNGTCVDRGKGIQVWSWCRCFPGYMGTYCQMEINYCTRYLPCQYNSTCTPSFMSYTCDCVPGTTDRNCSTVINNCVPYYDLEQQQWFPTRCNVKDATAQCINTINNFTCNCSAEWTGYYCDLNIIIEEVMMTIYGRVDYTMLPLLNNLLQTPAMISNMVPFIIGTLSPEERSNMSWSVEEMFDWATYEEKKLDLTRDFTQWNDVVLGNCYTFNHYNATQIYNIRSPQQQGGLKVRLKVNQDEYEPWTDTAAILVFIHYKEDYVMSESVRYNAQPDSEVIFYPYVNEYTRLGKQYGTCVNSIKEVRSFYFPGGYTTDGCLRSCYQDMVLEACDCMDPRYPMPADVTSCEVANMTCIDDAAADAGDPSTWEDCVCPLPCSNSAYGVTWSRGSYRIYPTSCNTPSGNTYTIDDACQAKHQDSVIVTVMQPKLTYSLFAETPTMDLNDLIGRFGALFGVLMGICAISFIELGVMIFRLMGAICCKPEQPKSKKRE